MASNDNVQELNTIVLQKTWKLIFDRLSDSDAGKLCKALFDFSSGGQPQLEDDNLQTLFMIMAERIENSSRRYIKNNNRAKRNAEEK